MSETPRTNAAQHNMGSVLEPHYVVDADFSRYLERELVAARAELAEAVTKERERCARVCEDMQRKKDDLFDGKWKTSGTTEIDGSNFAAAIRKGE